MGENPMGEPYYCTRAVAQQRAAPKKRCIIDLAREAPPPPVLLLLSSSLIRITIFIASLGVEATPTWRGGWQDGVGDCFTSSLGPLRSSPHCATMRAAPRSHAHAFPRACIPTCMHSQ